MVALAAPAVVALAEPVQQFSFQLTNVKPGGRYTVVFHSRTFDTTGGVPPSVTENYLRLPAGAKLNPQFLTGRFFCDGVALRDAIDRHIDPKGTPFTTRVTNLKPFIAMLSKSRSKGDRKALANAQACDRARIGNGTANVDARKSIPVLTDLIPSKFSVFFSKGTQKGAVAAMTIVGAATESSPIVKKYPVVAAVHVALVANWFNDPTPDGLYGYKLVLPTGPVSGLDVSIAEVNATFSGLTLAKGTCLKTGHSGRCVKRQKKTAFWFNTPKCPPSGQLNFQTFYGYASPTPSSTKTITLACPKFLL